MQETRKLLQKAYLSEKSWLLWNGAPELLQFDRRLGRVTKDTEERLRRIDYASRFETLEHFSSKLETVSIKSFVNAIAVRKKHTFLLKGPYGSGKTALLRRVCHFWAQGFCLRRFTLTLWLDLKAHPSAPSDVSFRTLLNYCLPQGSHLDSIQQWLERYGTQDVLIVIDGADGQAYSEWKPFIHLLVKTKTSVVLTGAHPWSGVCQYDLIGLSQDQISKQVIHHYRHNVSRAEEFFMYISEASNIRMFCYSPPYLAAVLFVFDSVSTTDLPNTWTKLFTCLVHCVLALSDVSDHDTLTSLASKAYSLTSTNSTLDWHHDYSNFFSRIIPPYQTMVTTGGQCCFTLPLLQQYLCAQHIHTLPHDQHMPALKKTIPLHVSRFYGGMCSTPELQSNTFKTSDLSISKNMLMTSFDIHDTFRAIHCSGILHKLEFHQCYFGSLAFEMMAKWLRAYSILPSGGAVQELRCVWKVFLTRRVAGNLSIAP